MHFCSDFLFPIYKKKVVNRVAYSKNAIEFQD